MVCFHEQEKRKPRRLVDGVSVLQYLYMINNRLNIFPVIVHFLALGEIFLFHGLGGSFFLNVARMYLLLEGNFV